MNVEPPQVLYRMFDATHTLLYVGITVNVAQRFSDHRGEKQWWTEITMITLEHFPDRRAVEAAERTAIEVERPRYNIRMARGVVRMPADAPLWQDPNSPSYDHVRCTAHEAVRMAREELLGYVLAGKMSPERHGDLVRESIELLQGLLDAVRTHEPAVAA